MQEPNVIFYDAAEWAELEWYNSGGTRAKRVLQSQDGAEWYFKCSEKKPAKEGKPEKYYQYEFWSEVIAYQLGNMLGLDMLRYDVAVHKNEIGCISPLMIKRGEEQLLEVGRYMTALNPDFLPEDTKTRTEYTFELLEKTLNEFKLTQYWPGFLSTLLFDAIIGNTDRHQENWAFIGKSSFMAQALTEVEKRIKEKGFRKLGWLIRNLYSRIVDKEKNAFNNIGQQIKLELTNIIKMAPVYDSGSSLARELNSERIEKLLENEEALNQYITKGPAEIHWKKNKISHFQLIENLLNSSYLEEVRNSAALLDNWDEARVEHIINNIDATLPSNWQSYRIPQSRKQLIIKLLHLRCRKIKELLNGGI